MSPFDARDRLAENPFSYRSTKDGRLLIYWQGKQVTILRGDKAEKITAELNQASDLEAQLILARVTGHFKHGNEHL
jgi:hypothetical protein